MGDQSSGDGGPSDEGRRGLGPNVGSASGSGPWGGGDRDAGSAPSGAPRAGRRAAAGDPTAQAAAQDGRARVRPPEDSERVDAALQARARGGRAPIVLLISAVLVGLHVWLDLAAPSASRLYFIYGLQPIDLLAIYPGSAPLEELRSLVTHMGLHGGWLHLGFNVLALLSFGPAVERSAGAAGFAALFFLAGVLGGLTHGLWEFAAVEISGAIDTRHLAIPLIGASGAISGVIGAEIVLRGRLIERVSARDARPTRAWPFILRTSLIFIAINAGLMFLPGLNISGAAHIGGYLFGLCAALALSGVSGSDSPRRARGPRRIG